MVFTLNVTAAGESDTDTVTITIIDSESNAPVADAGDDDNVNEGVSYTLDGTDSTDPNDDPLSFEWTQDSGPTVTLTGANTDSPSFVAPAVAENTPVVFTLNVTAAGESDTDTVTITIIDSESNAPVADAGDDDNVDEGTSYTLDGTDSTDPNDDPLSFEWTQDSGPTVTLTGANTDSPSFVAPAVAENTPVVFTLNVTAAGESDTDTVTITIIDSESNAPVADAGDDDNVNEGVSYTLDGTDSTDPNDDPLSFEWTQDSGPTVTLTGANTDSPSFVAPAVAENTPVVFTLNVTAAGESDTDTVTITIIDSESNAPVADAGDDDNVDEGTSYTLDGTDSTDPNDDPLSFEWTQDSGPTVTLTGANTDSPSFVAPAVAENTPVVFTLNVTAAGESDTDTVTITIIDSESNAPVADAGDDDNVNEGVSYTLDGTDSTDPNDDPLSFEWTQDSGPTVTLTDANTDSPSFVAPAVAENTPVVFTLNVTAAGESDTDTVTITIIDSESNAPVADAGDDDNVDEGTSYTLDGTDSTDPNDDPLSFEWTQDSGPTVTLTGANTDSPSFVAPAVAENTPVVFTLNVTAAGESDTDTVTITIIDSESNAPVADAGDDDNVDEGTSYTLDGTDSTDPNDDPLSFEWTQDSGPTVTLTGANTDSPSFVAPAVAENTPVVFTLNVTAAGESDTDTVTITIIDSESNAPVADAGDDDNVDEGTSYTLDGTDSTDPNDDPLSFEWTQDSGPTVTLTGANTDSPSFVAPAVAENTPVVFTLNVTAAGESDTDTVTITIIDSESNAPVADAGDDDNVDEGTSYTLDGTDSTDPNDDPLSFEWTQDSGPTVTLTGANTDSPSFVAPAVAENTPVVFTLNVTAAGESDTDTVTITIIDSESNAPVADAGDDDNVDEGTSYTLDGTDSTDPNDDPLSFEWTQDSGPTVTLTGANTDSPSFVAPAVAENTPVVFTLNVTAAGESDTDTVTITIIDSESNAPVADAGDDDNVNEGVSYTLDGTDSTDPNDDPLSFEWTQDSGPTVTLTGANTDSPSFVAPAVAENTPVVFTLNVTAAGESDTDTVTITIIDSESNAPVADAGDDDNVNEGVSYTLDGTDSTDPNDDPLSFEWTQDSGPTVTLTDANTDSPSFVAPAVAENTPVVFTLNVTAAGESDTDTVTITIIDSESNAPVADAGDDDNVDEGTSYTLDGTDSTDPNDDPLSFEWTQDSGPTVTLTDANTDSPSFVAPAVAENTPVVFTLNVTAAGESDTDTVTITIIDSESNAPVADAGDDDNVNEGVSYTLDGTDSTDPNDDPLSFEWTQDSGPTVTLTGANTDSPSFVAPAVAENTPVVFTLNVTAAGESDTDTVTITIIDSESNAPVADAGDDDNVNEGVSYTLDGTDSTDPNDDPLSFEWTQDSGPTVTLTGANTDSPSFVAPAVAENTPVVFTLNVTAAGESDTDTVTITIIDSESNAPVADAGDDDNVNEGVSYTLDGTDSTDPNDDPLSFEWTQDSGPTVTLTGANTDSPSFVAPAVAENTPVVFTLNVTAAGESDTDTVTITIIDSESNAPVADAGDDDNVNEGVSYTLDGTDSTDPNDDPLSFEWTQDSGPTVTLTGANTDSPSFVAPAVAENTPVVFTLNVTAAGESDTDTVTITIIDSESNAPVADAGDDDNVDEGTSYTLDGTDSTDPNDDPLSFEWTQDSGPTVTLTDINAVSPSFVAPAVAENTPVVFTLNVTAAGESDTDTVTITIIDSESNAPVADAGDDDNVDEGTSYTLDGTDSTDPNDDPLSFEWTQDSGPTVTLTGANTDSPSFVAPAVAENTPVVFTLNVTAAGESDTDTVTITIRNTNNSPVPTFLTPVLDVDGDKPSGKPGDKPSGKPGGKPSGRPGGGIYVPEPIPEPEPKLTPEPEPIPEPEPKLTPEPEPIPEPEPKLTPEPEPEPEPKLTPEPEPEPIPEPEPEPEPKLTPEPEPEPEPIQNLHEENCFVAVAYHPETEHTIQFLREVRDNSVTCTTVGASFMDGFNKVYYSFSPAIADLIRENPVFKEMVKIFLTPMILTLHLMVLADECSELHVLGLGILVLLLNGLVYLLIPLLALFAVYRIHAKRKKLRASYSQNSM